LVNVWQNVLLGIIGQCVERERFAMIQRQDSQQNPIPSRVKSGPRRFYKTASPTGNAAPFAIHLDGKLLRTPSKAPLQVPARGLAQAIAEEWQAQGETIDPFTMPLTRLANTAIDRVGPNLPRIIEEMVKFAGSDLVCYRAGEPPRLQERQAAMWDPVLAWAERDLDASLETASGVVFKNQPAKALDAIRCHIEGKSSWELAALHNMMTLTGSTLLPLMVARGAITGEDAWSAAHIDEDWQNEQWGVDEEAAARRATHRSEFEAAMRFLELLSA
jgi:chaperone required for assembly of F1-ATPase